MLPDAEVTRAAGAWRRRGEAAMRQAFGCRVTVATAERDDALTLHYAELYFGVIRPGHAGPLLNQPSHLLTIARIGDGVVAEAEARAAAKLKKTLSR